MPWAQTDARGRSADRVRGPGTHRREEIDVDVIVVTTPSLEGRTIADYKGIVSGEAILGANIFRDLFAGIRDIVGGRSAAYERELREAKRIAIEEMSEQAEALGANA